MDRDDLMLIGYWRGDRSPEWPDPQQFVDPSWDRDERDEVADYLKRGFVVHAFMGLSPCRMCGQPNGSLELSDGVFLWPEGLAHYVEEHQVRLPARFVEHVLDTTERLRGASVDRDWWRGVSADLPTESSG